MSTDRDDRRRMAQVAYEVIRDRIVRVRLAPGAPLDERVLAHELDVGLTPVREAFKRLALERLVLIYPRRGTFVADIHVRDEQWLTEVRIELEGLAAALAASRATPEEVGRLVELSGYLPTLGDTQKLVETDTQIHRDIYAATHNPYLQASLDQYFNLSLRIWYFCMDRLPTIGDHAHNQTAVIEAIRDGDSARARRSAEQHLKSFSQVVRSAF